MPAGRGSSGYTKEIILTDCLIHEVQISVITLTTGWGSDAGSTGLTMGRYNGKGLLDPHGVNVL